MWDIHIGGEGTISAPVPGWIKGKMGQRGVDGGL